MLCATNTSAPLKIQDAVTDQFLRLTQPALLTKYRAKFAIKRTAASLVLVAICMALTSTGFGQASDYDHALSLFRQRDWADAAVAFQEVEKKQPAKTDALLYRGKCLVNLTQFEEAADVLKTYLTSHPQSDDAVYMLAYVRFRQDKPKESLELSTDAAKLKTPSADDLKIVALDYVLLNDYADAGHYLEEALKMDPENIEARYHLGRVRYQQNLFAQAIAAFEEILKRDPRNAKAEANLGLCFEGLNQMEAATAAYRKAIEWDKSSPMHNEQPYLNLGILLGKSNRSEQAIPLLTRASEINPKSSQARYELGKAWFALGKLQEAQTATQEAVRLNPKDSTAHYLLARIYHRLGKTDLSAQEFKVTEALQRTDARGGGSPVSADRN
jgi:tetratricopeptide (TPR) repeat protein